MAPSSFLCRRGDLISSHTSRARVLRRAPRVCAGHSGIRHPPAQRRAGTPPRTSGIHRILPGHSLSPGSVCLVESRANQDRLASGANIWVFPRSDRSYQRKELAMSSRKLHSTILWLVAILLSLSSHTAAQSKGSDPEQRIRGITAKAVELSVNANEPPLQLSLQELMELYRIPAFSIAVIDDYKIAWAKAYGVTDAASKTPVTTRTLFQAGSISKPVAATGALYLVEKGKLSLDEPVNEKLKTWKVPDNEFTATQKVTLRRLMSHTAGLTVHGFPGYDVDEPLPTLAQILNGEKPANTAPIRVDVAPG